MDGPRGYWAKCSNAKTITMQFHVYVESKKQNRNRLINTETKLVVVREEEDGRKTGS